MSECCINIFGKFAVRSKLPISIMDNEKNGHELNPPSSLS